ncbi:hypothetical protein C8Q80DRAFT_810020 [Daedaleopsis nitida]|nr:hypothetical protein C8Q80DRAFT_810020 [Daedaleopsis nitida]
MDECRRTRASAQSHVAGSASSRCGEEQARHGQREDVLPESTPRASPHSRSCRGVSCGRWLESARWDANAPYSYRRQRPCLPARARSSPPATEAAVNDHQTGAAKPGGPLANLEAGRPRLLPVRRASAGNLPEHLWTSVSRHSHPIARGRRSCASRSKKLLRDHAFAMHSWQTLPLGVGKYICILRVSRRRKCTVESSGSCF